MRSSMRLIVAGLVSIIATLGVNMRAKMEFLRDALN